LELSDRKHQRVDLTSDLISGALGSNVTEVVSIACFCLGNHSFGLVVESGSGIGVGDHILVFRLIDHIEAYDVTSGLKIEVIQPGDDPRLSFEGTILNGSIIQVTQTSYGSGIIFTRKSFVAVRPPPLTVILQS
jgi:hypothetical protein